VFASYFIGVALSLWEKRCSPACDCGVDEDKKNPFMISNHFPQDSFLLENCLGLELNASQV
jgi:hypothetical protein